MNLFSNSKFNKHFGVKHNKNILEENELCSWHSGVFEFRSKKLIILVNDYSHFLVVVDSALIDNEENQSLERIIVDGIGNTLVAEKIAIKVVENYLQKLLDINYAKSVSRKLTLKVTSFVKKINQYGNTDYSIARIVSEINNEIKSRKNFETTCHIMKKELYKIAGLKLKPRRAYRLNTSFLGFPGVWRKIVIPAYFNFKQLHTVLQILYDWDDCHLHNFEVFFSRWDSIVIESAVDDGYYFGMPSDYIEEQELLVDYLEEAFYVLYTYDYGCQWEHIISLFSIIDDYPFDYPICLSGKGIAPNEDDIGYYEDYDDEDYYDYDYEGDNEFLKDDINLSLKKIT